MSAASDIVRALRDHFPEDAAQLSGDEQLRGLVLAFSDDVAWPDFEVAMVAPGGWGSERVGIEGYRESWADWVEPFESFRFVFGELAEGPEGVVQLVQQVGTPTGSAAEVRNEGAAVFKFREGRIARIEFHLDREAALRSAGIDPARSG